MRTALRKFLVLLTLPLVLTGCTPVKSPPQIQTPPAQYVAPSPAVSPPPNTEPTPQPPQPEPVVTPEPAPVSIPAPSVPSGATAVCNDGTYSYSVNHQGTCSHHGGVSKWLDGSQSSNKTLDTKQELVSEPINSVETPTTQVEENTPNTSNIVGDCQVKQRTNTGVTITSCVN